MNTTLFYFYSIGIIDGVLRIAFNIFLEFIKMCKVHKKFHFGSTNYIEFVRT